MSYAAVIESNRYVLRDGTKVIAATQPQSHFIKPFQFGDWLFYHELPYVNRLVARNLITGKIVSHDFWDYCMAYEPPVYDGRFVAFVGIFVQGKIYWPNTVWALVFDTQTGAALPPTVPLKRIGTGVSPYYCQLWEAVSYEASTISCRLMTIPDGFAFEWSIARFQQSKSIAEFYERSFCTIDRIGFRSTPVKVESVTEVPSWL